MVGMTDMDCKMLISAKANFGQTYMTANGARANQRLGGRDYLIQHNWVNFRKGRCAINQSEF
jgi:hypothetical protein